MHVLLLLLALARTDTLPRGSGQLDGTYRAPGPKYITFFPDAEIRFHLTGWGTYTMAGDVGRITFAGQTTIVWNVRAYADRLEIQGDSYQKLASGDGVKLAGTFRRADYKTLFATAQQGITFMAGGRFKDEGIFKAAFVQHRTSHGFEFDDGAPGTGSYRVKHYSLELTYENGRTKRAVFYLDPKTTTGDAAAFWFNEYLFARVQ